MSPQEIEKKIEQMIRVTPQQVTVAKIFLSKNFYPDPVFGIEKLLEAMQVATPEEICVHQSVDTDAMVKQAAEAISWKLAGCEAVWGLISSNLLIPYMARFRSPDLNLRYTTAMKGRGGHTTALSLNHLTCPVPATVRCPFSSSTVQNQPLRDPDLFLQELEIPNLHKEVEEALREAVRCFHHELYLACLTMLGRSSEGAWIELGLKLANAVERKSVKEAEKIRKMQQDVFTGVGKKIMRTLHTYEQSDLDDLRRESGVTLQDLRNSVVWADVVRDSRNSIHYGAKPAMPNSYEKVSALLIGAVPHLRILYRIYNAVDLVVT
jgi:hypothetical protein